MNFNDDLGFISKAKKVVETYLKTNASELEIAKISGIPYHNVISILNNPKYIKMCYQDDGKIANLVNTKRSNYYNELIEKNNGFYAGLLQMSFFNNMNEERQRTFLSLLVLHFRLKIDSLVILMGMNSYALYNYFKSITYNNNLLDKAIEYVFENENYDQDYALKSAIMYLEATDEAYENKNFVDYKRNLELISDKDVKELKTKIKNSESKYILSKDDYKTAFKYQLKYSLTNRYMAKVLKVGETTYRDNINSYLDYNNSMDELERYDALKNLFSSNYIRSHR